MRTYSEFQPTRFDARGLGCDDQQDWLVAPCGTNRDADRLTRSNWAVMCAEFERIDPEGNDHTVHRFGHWGPGWFELVLVRPGTACARYAASCEADLSGYPILSESHFSDLEYSEAFEYWEQMSLRERVKLCSEAGVSIFAARPGRDVPDSARVWEALTREC